MGSILKVGIQEDYPQFLKNKLRVSNFLYYVVFVLAIGYSTMIAIRMPELKFIAAFGLTSMIMAMLVNFMGMHRLYRVILCVVPVCTIFIYHIGVVADGNPPLPSSQVMILAFSVIPFIVFDARERVPLGISIAIGFFTLISFRWANSWLETTVDETALRTGYIQEVSMTVSFMILALAVYFLNYIMYNAELKRNKLMEEGEQRNLELLQKSEELQEHLRKIEHTQKEEQIRNWAAQGFTHFASILRGTDDLQHLSDELLKELTKYIDANQGALYITEGEKEELSLVLKSCYAFSRKKYNEKTIYPGQGLVGQCFLERDAIYITDVPQGYTHITSGLGDATPSAILIVPLIANEKVEGVLEFASFKPFPDHVKNFVEKIGVDIAATLGISSINSLTRRLLEEAQQQAEMMRAQEEEMRQNMEELAATQEEMQRKEQEYVRRIKDLEEKLQLSNV